MYLRTVISLTVFLSYFIDNVSCSGESPWSYSIKEKYYDLRFWAVKEPPSEVKLFKYDNNSNVIEFADTDNHIVLHLAHSIIIPSVNKSLLDVWQNDTEEEEFIFHWYADGYEKPKPIPKPEDKTFVKKTKSYYNFIISKTSTEIASSLDLNFSLILRKYYNYTDYKKETDYTLVSQENNNITCFKIVPCNNTTDNTKLPCHETVACKDSLLPTNVSVHTEMCILQRSFKLKCSNITLSTNIELLNDTLDFKTILHYEYEENEINNEKHNYTVACLIQNGDIIKSVIIVPCNDSFLSNGTSEKNGTENCLKIVPYSLLPDDLIKAIFDSRKFKEETLNITVNTNGSESSKLSSTETSYSIHNVVLMCKTTLTSYNETHKETKRCYRLKKRTHIQAKSSSIRTKKQKFPTVVNNTHWFRFKLKYVGAKTDDGKSKKSYFDSQDKNILIFISVIVIIGVLCYGIRYCWLKSKRTSYPVSNVTSSSAGSNIVTSSESTSTTRFQELPNIQRSEGVQGSTSRAGIINMQPKGKVE